MKLLSFPVKPKAPFNLTLQYTNGTYNFSWTNGYEDEYYGSSLPIIYNFLYYKDGDNDSVRLITLMIHL